MDSRSLKLEQRTDAFGILGLTHDADEATIRARYLELVKKFPPDREPDKFREIAAAYEATKDPLTIANKWVGGFQSDPPTWKEVIDEQSKILPRLSMHFMLSLGNREQAPNNASPPA